MACAMPEPCKLLYLDSCQKRLSWTYMEADLAPYQVIGFVLRVGDTKKFPHALGFESLDPFLGVNKQAGA